ncbi:palmitoyltransferase swf1 [Anaeramoeba flamelloides]|nr:palmitoyltransferase swf1 [Anaeramoeba flamelloides]
MHTFLTYTIYLYLRKFITKVFGQKAGNVLSGCGSFLCYSRNPFVLIFYLGITFGGLGVFFNAVFPEIRLTPTLGDKHFLIVPMVIGSVAFSFLLSAITDPGTVTKDNVDHYLHTYEYDQQIYFKKKCKTCGFYKPARSKHCRILKRCIARYDHYCAWLMNSVGERNYRYFLMYLFTNFIMTTYGSYLVFKILKFKVQESGMFTQTFYDERGNVVHLGFSFMIQYLLAYHRGIFGLGGMIFLMSLVVGAFIGYHLYLISKDTTTNETFKYMDLKSYIKKRRRQISEGKENKKKDQKEGKGDGKKAKEQGEKEKENNQQKVTQKKTFEIIPEFEEMVNTLDINNIKSKYNKGFLKNLFTIFFPPSSKIKTK